MPAASPEAQARAARLFFDRWFEQLDSSNNARRVRTLSPCGAVEELIPLSEGWLRSGGTARPAIDPDDGGHGVAMLPDVAAEAEKILRRDVYLSRDTPARRDALVEVVGKLKKKPDDDVVRDALGQLRVLVEPTRRRYVHGAFDRAISIVRDEPGLGDDVVNLCENLLSELRLVGWTDVGPREVAAAVRAHSTDAMIALRDALTASASAFTCYVFVTLPLELPRTSNDDPTFLLEGTLPALPQQGRPLRQGRCAKVVVDAHDPTGAAVLAHRRVLATIGALSVMLPASRVDVASEVVAVVVGDHLRGCETQERLTEEKRTAKQDHVTRILSSSWKASSRSAADPLHDAIRLRHRAVVGAHSSHRDHPFHSIVIERSSRS